MGLPAWNVRLGQGSFVTLEFGPAAIANPTHDTWHFWGYCCAWRLETPEDVLTYSEDDRPPAQTIANKNLTR